MASSIASIRFTIQEKKRLLFIITYFTFKWPLCNYIIFVILNGRVSSRDFTALVSVTHLVIFQINGANNTGEYTRAVYATRGDPPRVALASRHIKLHLLFSRHTAVIHFVDSNANLHSHNECAQAARLINHTREESPPVPGETDFH